MLAGGGSKLPKIEPGLLLLFLIVKFSHPISHLSHMGLELPFDPRAIGKDPSFFSSLSDGHYSI